MKLSDFFRRRARRSDPEVRRAAIAALEDRVALTSIAVSDPDGNAKLAALARLAELNVDVLAVYRGLVDKPWAPDFVKGVPLDQESLGEIAKGALSNDAYRQDPSGPADPAARLALGRLSDQVMIEDVAFHAESLLIRAKAVELIRDQHVLEAILKAGCEQSRRAAVRKIDDQRLLASLCLTDPDILIRSLAVARLSDVGALCRIAIDRGRAEEDMSVRAEAIRRLCDVRDDYRRALVNQCTSIDPDVGYWAHRDTAEAIGTEGTEGSEFVAGLIEVLTYYRCPGIVRAARSAGKARRTDRLVAALSEIATTNAARSQASHGPSPFRPEKSWPGLTIAWTDETHEVAKRVAQEALRALES